MRTFILCVSLMGFAIVLRPLDDAGAGFEAVAGTGVFGSAGSGHERSGDTSSSVHPLPTYRAAAAASPTSAALADESRETIVASAEGSDRSTAFTSERRMWDLLTAIETAVRDGDFARREELAQELTELFAREAEQAHGALEVLADASAVTAEVRETLVRSLIGVPDSAFQEAFRNLMVERSRASRDSYPKNAAFVAQCISDPSRPDRSLELVRRMPAEIAEDPAVAAELESLARHASDPDLRGFAIQRLAKGIGEASVALLMELADDPDPAARIAALSAMSSIKTSQGGDLLLRIARDTSELGELRGAAMRALAYHAGTPGATSALIEHCFHDPDDSVRVHSLHALAKHARSSEDAARALYRVLQETDDEQSQIVAADALRRAEPIGELVGELEAMQAEAAAPVVASLLGGVIERWTANGPGGVPR